MAIRAKDGRTLWSQALPSRAESSPLLDHGRLYFGTENGTVFALNAAERVDDLAGQGVRGGQGRPRAERREALLRRLLGPRLRAAPLRRQAALVGGHERGPVRSGLGQLLRDGLRRLRARLPRQHRRQRLLLRPGHRQARLAHAHGRLRLLLGGRGNVPRLGPSVFVGSYDGTFYALDAKSGAVRWSKHEGGAISGGSTLVGDIVYSANIRTKRTTGYSARTGRVLFTFPDGSYNPVVSDGQTIFLDGYKRIYALRPRAAGKAGALTGRPSASVPPAPLAGGSGVPAGDAAGRRGPGGRAPTRPPRQRRPRPPARPRPARRRRPGRAAGPARDPGRRPGPAPGRPRPRPAVRLQPRRGAALHQSRRGDVRPRARPALLPEPVGLHLPRPPRAAAALHRGLAPGLQPRPRGRLRAATPRRCC